MYMTRQYIKKQPKRRGFTMAEMMIALAIMSLIFAGAVPTYIMCLRTWTQGSVDIQAAQECSFALARIVYGVGAQYGLRSAVASSVTGVPATSQVWTVTYTDIAGWTNSFSYNGTNDYLTYVNVDTPAGANIGKNIIAASVTNMPSSLGITISITCCAVDGRYVSTNTMTTSIRWRN